MSDGANLPVLTGASMDAKGTITATWKPQTGQSSFTLAVYQTGMPRTDKYLVGKSTVYGNAGQLPLDRSKLDGTRAYDLVISPQTNNPQQWSDPLPVVFLTVENIATACRDGGFDLTWTLPAVNNFKDFLIQVDDGAQRTPQRVPYGTEGRIVPKGGVKPGATYNIQIAALNDSFEGPPADAPAPILTAPPLQSLDYGPGGDGKYKIDALSQATGKPPGQVWLQLFADGEESGAPVKGVGGMVTVTLDRPLSSWAAHSAAVFYRSGDSSGPYGDRVPVLTHAPTVIAANFDGDTFRAAWTALPGGSPIEGAFVQILDDSGLAAGGRRSGQQSVAFPPSTAPGGGKSWHAVGQLVCGPSTGPKSDPLPMVVAAPAVTGVDYDGERLAVQFANPAPPNIDACRLHVLGSGGTVADVPAGTGGGTLDIRLDTGKAWTVASQGTAPATKGPLSAPVSVIAAAPVLGAITVGSDQDGAFVRVPVAAPDGLPQGATMRGELWQGDRQRVAGPTEAEDGVFTFRYDVSGKAGITVRARAEATVGDAAVTGPWCVSTPVPVFAPTLTEVNLAPAPGSGATPDNWVLDAAWTLPVTAAAQGATLTLQQGGATVFHADNLPGHRSRQIIPADSLDTSKPATLICTVSTAFGTGPAGAPVDVVMAAPNLSARLDDNRLVASWEASAAPLSDLVRGYRAVLLALDGDAAEPVLFSAPTEGTTAALPLNEAGISTGASYALGIEVRTDGARTLTATREPLVLSAPILKSITVDGANATLTWDKPADIKAPTSYTAVFSVAGRPPVDTDLPGDKTGDTVDLTAIHGLLDDPLRPAEVTLVAHLGNASGPPSNAVTLLRHSATGLEADITSGEDGGDAAIRVSWQAAPGPMEVYDVKLAVDGQVAHAIQTPKTQARLPLPDPVEDKTYSVIVAPADGCGIGPDSTPLSLVLKAPGLSAPSYDGRELSLTVALPGVGDASIDAVEVEILRNGAAVWSRRLPPPAQGKPLTLATAPLYATAANAVRARACAGRAAGPFSAAVAVQAACPAITSIVTGTDKITVTAVPGDVPTDATLQAALVVDGVVGTPQPLSDGKAVFDIPDKPCALTVRAVSGDATGPWAASVPAITDKPTITRAAFDGQTVAIAWTDADNSGGTYTVRLLSGNQVVGETTATGLSAELSMPVAGADGCDVTRIDGIAQGPASDKATLMVKGCAITRAATGDDGKLTLDWQAPSGQSGVTGYQIVLSAGGVDLPLAPTAGTDTHAVVELPGNLAGLSVHATVRAIAGAASGPTGLPVPVVTDRPSGLAAYYDGRDLIARWTAVDDPRVDGYVATVRADGIDTITFDVAEPRFRHPFDLSKATAGKPVTVTVAAKAGNGIGPTTAGVDARGGNPADYVQLLPQATRAAVYPCATVPPAKGALTAYLPELFTTHKTDPIAQGPFTLQPLSNPRGPYSYSVTVAADSPLWDFSDQRGDVAADFSAFVDAIAGDNDAVAGAAYTVRDAVAPILPQTFDEGLRLRYALGDQSVDLRPGMQLALRFEAFQYVDGSAAPYEGMVSNGEVVLDVFQAPGEDKRAVTGLDAFLYQLKAYQLSLDGGAGGPIGVQTAFFRRRYLRLIYPRTMASSAGYDGDRNHAVALVASDDWNDLANITRSARNGLLPQPGPGSAIGIFRGRATAQARIKVSINDAPVHVPLGTTLASLLAGNGPVPSLGGLTLDGVGLLRPLPPFPAPDATAVSAAAARPVMIAYDNLTAFPDGSTVFDLPLAQGDKVAVRPGLDPRGYSATGGVAQ